MSVAPEILGAVFVGEGVGAGLGVGVGEGTGVGVGCGVPGAGTGLGELPPGAGVMFEPGVVAAVDESPPSPPPQPASTALTQAIETKVE